jgi:hypothetical protein
MGLTGTTTRAEAMSAPTTARALLAAEWAMPLGLELVDGDWRALCTVALPPAVLPRHLPGDEITALWAHQGRPIAWTSQTHNVDDDLRRLLERAARQFGLAYDVFRLPALAETDRSVLIVWEGAAEPASVIRRTQAPKVAEE